MQTQKSRSFDEISVGDLFKTIASEHGLIAKVAPSIASIQIEHIDQTSESNLAFLYRVARQYGGTLKPTYTRLLVLKADGQTAKETYLPTVELDIKEISKLDYTEHTTNQYKSVIAEYHDQDKGQTKEVRAGSGEPVFKLSNIYENGAAAQAIADNVLKGYKSSGSNMHITTIGNANIIAGVPIKINDLRIEIPNSWLVKTVVHTQTKQGYQSYLKLVVYN
ncbi:contractile injection system protein, VgrG/Pvc8 family [Francisellaceae bacterium]|nr:contractile injection system protein, VgrG/Pvc8 family [Francisellaceae bacterium]